MKKFYLQILALLMIFSSGMQLQAQVNGSAANPIVSTNENPVWYLIESASDGSDSFSGFTGDFRGNVLISPTVAGKLIHNKLNTASSKDHALWQLIEIDSKIYLKNKGTGWYMTGAHSVGTGTTTNEFSYTVIAGMQYRIQTKDAGLSYTNTWQNNLCDRLNITHKENGLTAWYFINGGGEDALSLGILSAQSLVNNSKIGSSPGQISEAARVSLQNAIDVAITARDNGDTSDDTAALATLEAAVATFQASKNDIQISSGSTEHWYWIKGLRGSTSTALYAESMGVGEQILNKDRQIKDEQLWKIVENGAGYAVVNKKTGAYMNTDIASNTILKLGSSKPSKVIYFRVSTYKTDSETGIDYFIIEDNTVASSATFRLHAGAGGHNFGLMNWTGDASDNSSFQLIYYDANDALSVAILTHEQVYSQSASGINPGTYPESAKAAYRVAIDAAIAVKENSASSEEDKSAAIAALEAAQQTFLASKNEIKISTEGNETWYYIVSAHTGYAKDKVLLNQGTTAGTSILFTDKTLDPNKLWKFVDAGNGKYAIQNRASSLYISANPRNSGTSASAVGFNVSWLDTAGQLLLKADGQDYLHAQQAGSLLVTWSTNDAGSASAWKLEELAAVDAQKPMEIESVTINQGTYTTTGIGNKDHGLSYISIRTSGLVGEVHLNSIKLDFTGTNNVNAIDKIKIYNAESAVRLDAASQSLLKQINKPATATTATDIVFDTPIKLNMGVNNFYIAVDVAEEANEGDLLKNRVASVNYDSGTENNKTFTLNKKTIDHASIIFLKRSIVFKPGDYGSVSYRIPAIITADDGALVTLTDKRKNNDVDLPQDIDILARRSTDGGVTWSDPVTVALGTGYGKGFGDAAIIKTNSGKLVALYVGGVGLWNSTTNNPQRHYMSTSDDHGVTWTAPKDITPQLYGFESTDPVRKTWVSSFFGSGRGLTLRDGRIMAVMAVVEPNMSGLQNYAVYSDDEGETWQVSSRAIVGGDEAKVVELNDGTILMSSRIGGNRLWAKSTDRGESWGSKNSWSEIWGNACDADIIRYTSTLDGFDKNRLLHTLPNAGGRENLTMWISYNEGSSWGTKKTICPGTSAYSSITILPDGTIGVYFEEDGSKAYTMTFVNFSLEWLTSGNDSYKPLTNNVNQSGNESQLKILVVDGKIEIPGFDDEFRVFNLSGAEINSKAKLDTGVYLVNIGNHTNKVIVR